MFKSFTLTPRRMIVLRKRLTTEYNKNFKKNYELPLAIHVNELMRELFISKNPNKVLKDYYYVKGYLHSELEKEVS
mgnify:FL=1